MSIYGVSNSSVSRPTPQLPLRDRTQTQTPATPATLPAAAPLTTQKTSNAKLAQQAVPAEAPAGTDPALWSVLSSDERAFFAKSGAMGPLTYGRALRDMNAPQMPASRGGRLDVKV
jgi:hypothetical protein